MAVKLGHFEMPNRLIKEDDSATATYGKFIAEPFERGYGYTIGNSLRRVLLSSLEGAAITSVKIEGCMHEYATMPSVVEDVIEIILNLKQVLIKMHTKAARKLEINVNKQGAVTAGDIKGDSEVEILNPGQHIATLDKKVNFKMELEVGIGRGYVPAERNKKEGQAIGVIPIDSIFSPVRKVKYYVENTRVGQMTDYDRLIVEIWTDGRITPEEALRQSSGILRKHLDIFVDYNDNYVEFERMAQSESSPEAELEKKLNMNISEIELSVRSANCINNAGIKTLRDLVCKTEPEMLKYRNFGKKSLNEIKAILTGMGMSLGMKIDADEEAETEAK
ncbi:MAG TPA: DNA-directed RNA polymerase subunit alpha [bacterium]|nr:DNA-directed RNA polymerase subunit alpha [bacterium]